MDKPRYTIGQPIISRTGVQIIVARLQLDERRQWKYFAQRKSVGSANEDGSRKFSPVIGIRESDVLYCQRNDVWENR